MTTENNVAAQAGDEPMRTALNAEIAMLRKALEYYADPKTNAPGAVARDALAASPRATADVEREAKRQAERVERLVRAAKVYTFNYLQDEYEEAELCTCGPKQHAELVELFAALAAIATTKPGA